jgi:hypothetical protein
MLAAETTDAASRIVKRARDLHKRRATLTEREAKIAAVALKHDLEVLNRGGVPAKSVVDANVAPLSPETAAQVAAIVRVLPGAMDEDGEA